jgi:hypothetical protein
MSTDEALDTIASATHIPIDIRRERLTRLNCCGARWTAWS